MIWAGPLAILVALWVVLAFSAGGYVQDAWLPATLLVSAVGGISALLRAYPRRPGRAGLLVLALWAIFAGWLALSALWSPSIDRSWDESLRALFYLVILGSTLTFLQAPQARPLFRWMLVVACLFAVVAAVTRFFQPAQLEQMFDENRLRYPISYVNGAAAFYLVPFWPLVGLAALISARRLLRILALGIAAALLPLATLSQSRGAVWALVITALLALTILPQRLRILVYVAPVLLLGVWSFPKLNAYWTDGPLLVPGNRAAWQVLICLGGGALWGLTLSFLERWVRPGVKARLLLGAGVLLAVTALAVPAGLRLMERVEDPEQWARQTWDAFARGKDSQADDVSAQASGRLLRLSSSGRWDLWRVAWLDFRSAPLLGTGAGSYQTTYQLHRQQQRTVREAHSLQLGVLAETGAVGFVLLFGALAAGWVAMLKGRARAAHDSSATLRAVFGLKRRARHPPDPVLSSGQLEAGPSAPPVSSNPSLSLSHLTWRVCLALGVAYWILHAAVDWLWEIPGVTVVALLLLAMGIAEAASQDDWEKPGEDSVQVAGLSRRSRKRKGQQPRLPHLLRPLACSLTLLTFILALLPYLAFQHENLALSKARTETSSALQNTGRAALLQPFDPRPLEIRSAVFVEAARMAAAREDEADSVAAYLALAAGARASATRREPSGWLVHFREAESLLELAAARDPALPVFGAAAEMAGTASRGSFSHQDDLRDLLARTGVVGLSDDELALAEDYLSETPLGLVQRARETLRSAQSRNPRSREVSTILGQLSM